MNANARLDGVVLYVKQVNHMLLKISMKTQYVIIPLKVYVTHLSGTDIKFSPEKRGKTSVSSGLLEMSEDLGVSLGAHRETHRHGAGLVP